jgi:translocation and assembly module TamB
MTRVAWGFVGITLALAAAAFAAMVWIGTPGGKARLATAMNGLAAGEVRLTAIGGDLPFHPTIGRIELLDPQGVWATLQDIRLDLAPRDLLRRRLTITRLSAAAVDVIRLPRHEQPTSSSGFVPPPLDVDLQHLTIGAVHLPAELLDEPTTWAVNADARLIGRDARLDLAVAELGASPARIDVNLEMSGRRVGASAVVDDPRGLFLRRALGTAEPLQVRLTDADGGPHSPTDWNGRLSAVIGGQGRLDALVHLASERDARVFGIDGRFDGVQLVPARLAPLIASGLDIHLAVRDVEGNGMALDRLMLKSDAFEAEGTGRYRTDRKFAHATVRVELPDLSRLSDLAGQPLTGAASVNLTARGPPDALRAELALHGTGLGYGTLTVADMSTHMSGAAVPGRGYEIQSNGELVGARSGAEPLPARLGDRVVWTLAGRSDRSLEDVDVTDLSLSSAWLSLRGSGAFNRGTQHVTATLQLAASDLAPSTDVTGFPVKGHGEIAASVDGNLAGTASITLRGGLNDVATSIPAADALVGGRLAVDLAARRDPAGAMTLDHASLRLAHALVHVSGAAEPATDTVTGKLQAVINDVSVLRQAGLPAAGRLNLDGEVSGSMAAPAVDLRIGGSGLAWAQARMDRVTARLRATAQGAPAGTLTAELRSGALVVNVNGEGGLSADHKTFDLSRLRITSGRNRIEARLRTALDTLLTQGELSADLSGLRPLSPLAGRQLDGRMTLKLGLSAQSGGQSAKLTFAADDLHADTLHAHHLAATVALTDLLRHPAGHIQLTGDGINAASAAIHTLRASARSSRPDRFTVEGDVMGELQGPFAVTGASDIAMDSGTTRITVTRLAGRVADTPFRLQRPLLVTAHGPALAMDGLGLALGDGTISGDAKLDPGSLMAKLDARGLPVALAGRLAGRSDLAGTIDARVDVGGPAAQPRGRVDVEGHDLHAGAANRGAPPIGIAAQVSLAAGQIQLTAWASAAGHQLLSASGTVPVVFGPRRGMVSPAEDRAMALRLRGDGELGDVADLLPLAGDRLAGHFHLAVDATGTLARPEVAGDLSLDRGHYENLASGLVVDALALDVAADRDRISLRRLTATDGGKGRLAGSGSISLGSAPAADLTVSLTGFQALRRSDASLTASGSTTIKGKLEAAVIVARLTVDRAEFFIPDPPPSSAQKIPVTVIDSSTGAILSQPGNEASSTVRGGGMLLDIAVHVPGRTFVRGRGLDGEWRGDVQVRGTSGAPEITGALTVAKGTLSFFGKDMILTRGTVSFTGGHKIEPDIDVLAETTTSDGTFDVGAAGTPDQLKITLSSTPAMPQDEILSRLIFGRDMTQLTPVQGVQLAQAAATLTSGGPGMLDKIRHKLGLDVLNVGSMNDNDALKPSPQSTPTGGNGGMGNTGVSGGKYVANGVYVGAEQGLSGETRTKVQVEVLPHVNVESGAGTRSQDVGITWQTDY